MENEKKKRGREEEDDNKVFILKSSKRQDGYHHYDYDYDKIEEESENYTGNSSDNTYLGLGVFDFPWLHDEGMISKSSEEYCNFQDIFSSSFHDTFTEPDVEFSKQLVYEIPTNASIISSSENKFEENNGEDESVDCIWSSLLNQPLQHICI